MPKLPKKSRQKYEPACYIGIDPGKKGALAFIFEAEECLQEVWTIGMPETPRDLLHCVNRADANLPPRTTMYVALERVGARPGDGNVGMFNFGMGYGRLQMVALLLTNTNVGASTNKERVLNVSPKTWQNGLEIEPRVQHTHTEKWKNREGEIVDKPCGGETVTQWKKRLAEIADSLFSSENLLVTAKSRDRADALLIAEYCRRYYIGELK